MTCYNTCAYPGCQKRIPYEPGQFEIPRYCEEHEDAMDTRLRKATASDGDIFNALYRVDRHTARKPE